jgi:hypothetical protein
MKTLLSIALLATTLSSFAQVGLPSLSNSDFDATATKAAQNAEIVAEQFAANNGVELVDITQSKRGRYNAVTNTDCKFTVKVGLGFRANVIAQTNCQ